METKINEDKKTGVILQRIYRRQNPDRAIGICLKLKANLKVYARRLELIYEFG